MNEYGPAAVHDPRDTKANEKLEILGFKRAFAEMQNILRNEDAWSRTDASALLMPHGPV
jgi:hypothetical protein